MQKNLTFFKFRQNIAQISNLGDEIAHLATLLTRPFVLGPEPESPKSSPKMADPKKLKARKEARPPTAFFAF